MISRSTWADALREGATKARRARGGMRMRDGMHALAKERRERELERGRLQCADPKGDGEERAGGGHEQREPPVARLAELVGQHAAARRGE